MLSPALREFHDKVYVLTIPGADDRQANVREQLGEGNFEFVFGVDGSSLTKEELISEGVYDEELARRVDPRDRAMTVGHICCSLGHRRVYETFLASGCQRALIFEDDVVAYEIPEERIESALSNAPPHADVIHCGWWGGRFCPPLGQLQQAIFHVRRFFGVYKLTHTMIRNLYMRPYNDHFYIASVNFLAHAYTITRAAAPVLIRWNNPINLNADHVLIHAALANDIKSYVAREQLFGQRSFDPDDPMPSLTTPRIPG